ncbi:hypothetical protein [Chlamydia sp.]|uniref:hypothetical protein n=1 Tax=Chlamydia sp. TaxID=35827 RepID=UPI0025C0650A|nr:hypothetical protein [Chlamydia sp.]MBQ8498328.1 hypothetical protein [Chlamydia sp.]
MNRYRFSRLFLCLSLLCYALYRYIDKQNDLTKLRLEIPCLWAQLRQVEQENVTLSFLLEKLESPEHLLQIASLPEYQYLEYLSEEKISVLAHELS